jgi:hypothetical protein
MWMEDMTNVTESEAEGKQGSDHVDDANNTAERRHVTVEDVEDKEMPGICKPGRKYGRCTTKFERLQAAKTESHEEAWLPFSSIDEWCLVKWMIMSGLSQTEIEKLLKLKLVSDNETKRSIRYLHMSSIRQKTKSYQVFSQSKLSLRRLISCRLGKNGQQRLYMLRVIGGILMERQ